MVSGWFHYIKQWIWCENHGFGGFRGVSRTLLGFRPYYTWFSPVGTLKRVVFGGFPVVSGWFHVVLR